MNLIEVRHSTLTEVLPQLRKIVDSTQYNSLHNPFESLQSLNDLFGVLSLTNVVENEEVLKKLLQIFETGISTLLIIEGARAETSVRTFQGSRSIHNILSNAFPTLALPSVPKLDYNAFPARIGNLLLRHLNTVKKSVATISHLLLFFKDIFFNCRVANKFYREEFMKVSTVLISAISVLEDNTNELELNEDKFLLAFLYAIDKPFKMLLNVLWLLFTIPELNLAYDVVFVSCKLILRVLVTTLGSLFQLLEFYLKNTCEPLKDEILKVIKEVQKASRHMLDAESTETDCDVTYIDIETNSLPNSTSVPTYSVVNATIEDPSLNSNQSSHFCVTLCEMPSTSSVESSLRNKSVPNSSVLCDNYLSQLNSSDICDKSVVITPTTSNVCESPFKSPDSTVKDRITGSAILSTEGDLSTSLTNEDDKEDDISVVYMNPLSEPVIFHNVNDVCFDALPTLLRERLLKLIWQIQDFVGHFSFLKIGCQVQVICKICGSVLLVDNVEDHIRQTHPEIQKSSKVDEIGPTSHLNVTFNNKKVEKNTASSPEIKDPIKIMKNKTESEHCQGQINFSHKIKSSISFTIKKKTSKLVPFSNSARVFSNVKKNYRCPKPISTETNHNLLKPQTFEEENSTTKALLENETNEVKSVPEIAASSSDILICNSELKPDKSKPKVCGIAQSFFGKISKDGGTKSKKRKKEFSESDLKQRWGSSREESSECKTFDYKMQRLERDGSLEISIGSAVKRIGFISEPKSSLGLLKDIPMVELESLTDNNLKIIEILSIQLKFQINHFLLKMTEPEISAVCKFCLKPLLLSEVEAHVFSPSHLHTLFTKAKQCTEFQKEIPEISPNNWQFLEFIEDSQSYRCSLCMAPLGNVISWVQHFQSFLHRGSIKYASLPNPVEEWLASVTILRDSLKDSFSGLEVNHQERIVDLIKVLKTEFNVFSVEKSEKLFFCCFPCTQSVSSKGVIAHVQNVSHQKKLHQMRRHARGKPAPQSSSDETIQDIVSCIKPRRGRNSLISENSLSPLRSNTPQKSNEPQGSNTTQRSNFGQRSDSSQNVNSFKRSNVSQIFNAPQKCNTPQRFDTPQRLNLPHRYNFPHRFNSLQTSNTQVKNSSAQNACLVNNSNKEASTLCILHQYFVKPSKRQPVNNPSKNLCLSTKSIQGSKGSSLRSRSLRPKVLNHPERRSHSPRDKIPELCSKVAPYQEWSAPVCSSVREHCIPVVLNRCSGSAQAADINIVSSSVNSTVSSLNFVTTPINSSINSIPAVHTMMPEIISLDPKFVKTFEALAPQDQEIVYHVVNQIKQKISAFSLLHNPHKTLHFECKVCLEEILAEEVEHHLASQRHKERVSQNRSI